MNRVFTGNPGDIVITPEVCPTRSDKMPAFLSPGQRRWLRHSRRTLASRFGLIRQYVPGSDDTVLTPYSQKRLAARRAKNAVAKQARKVNRG